MNVYDFDNTIYRGESGLDLFFFYLKKQPSLIRHLPKTLMGYFKYQFGLVPISSLLNDYAGFAEEFFSKLENVEQDITDFWDKHMHKIKPFYMAQKQDEDLIISASPEILLSVLFERLDIKNFMGTTIDKETRKIDFVCFRENKISAFKSRYPDTIIENFYTDSMNDKPLMDLSKNVFLVKGNRIRQIKP